MKKLTVFIIFTIFLILTPTQAMAWFLKPDGIEETIRKFDLERNSTISVSIKNVKTGRSVYKRNSHKLLNPASSLKIYTFISSLWALGKDYTFETSVCKDNENNLYFKLGADPLLTSQDLRELVKKAKAKGAFKNINKIYIEDGIIDKTPYPDGWMTDDVWPFMPKISPYTLDKNTAKVEIILSQDKKNITILQSDKYQLPIINELESGVENDIETSKAVGMDAEVVNLKGTIEESTILQIPVSNPKAYFLSNLYDVFKKEDIAYEKPIYFVDAIPANSKQIAFVGHTIQDAGKEILQNSDCFVSEVVFRVAAGKYYKKRKATTKDGINMFFECYKNFGLDTSEIELVDASGVSRYNLMSADWMTNGLVYVWEKLNIKDYLAQPNQGTLRRRLRHLEGKVWAKTGTLKGVSSLSGYIDAKNGSTYAFVIIVQNFNKKPGEIKGFEDDIIDDIFKL